MSLSVAVTLFPEPTSMSRSPKALAPLPHNAILCELPKLLQDLSLDGEVAIRVDAREVVAEALLDFVDYLLLVEDAV